MKSPPTIGPKAMGMRLTRECIDTPMVRLFRGRASATRLMLAGSEMAVHERKRTAPRITAVQLGMRMTMVKPAIAMMLNTNRARLNPNRSER